MEQRPIGFIVLLAICLIATGNSHAQETRANPRSTKLNTTTTTTSGTSAKLQKQSQGADCGTADDIAKQVEVCAKPWMDLLQGSVEKWPRVDDDAMKLCDSFAGAERCIREVSRKCSKGIQKTIISTLAHSIQRARKRECSRAKASGIVRTTMCLEKNTRVVNEWMGNVTGRLSAIELQTRESEKKMNAACCIVRDIEFEIKAILDPLCPTESAMINRLYRAVLEDVIELVCRSPKCNNYMKNYKVTKSLNFDGIISIILRIVFSLDNQ